MPFTLTASDSLEQWWAVAMKNITIHPTRVCAVLLRTISLKTITLGDYFFVPEGCADIFFSDIAKGFILEAFVTISKFVQLKTCPKYDFLGTNAV